MIEPKNEPIMKQVVDWEIRAKADDDGRILRFIGSTGVRDRMGDEISPRGWDIKNYKKNPVFLWSHSYSELPIGRAVSIEKTDDALLFDIEFVPEEVNPKAEQVYQLYKRGFLKATSVGFRSLDSEWIDTEADDEIQARKKTPDVVPGKKFKKVELMELSAVPVPANPEALMVARRKGMAMPEELERVLDADIAQTRAMDGNDPVIPLPGGLEVPVRIAPDHSGEIEDLQDRVKVLEDIIYGESREEDSSSDDDLTALPGDETAESRDNAEEGSCLPASRSLPSAVNADTAKAARERLFRIVKGQ